VNRYENGPFHPLSLRNFTADTCHKEKPKSWEGILLVQLHYIDEEDRNFGRGRWNIILSTKPGFPHFVANTYPLRFTLFGVTFTLLGGKIFFKFYLCKNFDI